MTVIVASTINTLAACLPALGATELGRVAENELEVALPVMLSDGRCPVYHLRISVAGASASAFEVTPTLLPAFCPERHINADGSFCLYWRPVNDIVISGPDSALVWWETLVRFLQLQTRAARRRRWPEGQGRAHGSAAIHQFRAEQAAEHLGGQLSTDVKEGRLSVRVHGNKAEPTIRVIRADKRVFSVWLRSRRVVNLRRPCLCPAGGQTRPKVIRSCSDHAAAAVTLALELHSMAEQEQRFWNMFAEQPCCGTIDGCPLAQPKTAKSIQTE